MLPSFFDSAFDISYSPSASTAPGLLFAHVLSDTIVTVVCLATPGLMRWWAKRRAQPLSLSAVVFGLFVVAAALVHGVAAIAFWLPAYGWRTLLGVGLSGSAVTLLLALRARPLGCPPSATAGGAPRAGA